MARVTHPGLERGEVLLLRSPEPSGTPVTLPPPPPRAGGGLLRFDAWVVLFLLVATAALAFYDSYVFLTMAAR